MKIKKVLISKSKELRKQLSIIYYAGKDERTGILPKFVIGITILYAASPIDLIPDFIPILGYLDDLLIIPSLIWVAIKLIPKEVIIDSKERALTDPIKLKKNWLFAVLIIGIWGLVIILTIKAIIRKLKFA